MVATGVMEYEINHSELSIPGRHLQMVWALSNNELSSRHISIHSDSARTFKVLLSPQFAMLYHAWSKSANNSGIVLERPTFPCMPKSIS